MSGSDKQHQTSKPEVGQLPLPTFQIEVRTASGGWIPVEKIPPQGRYRITVKATPSDAK